MITQNTNFKTISGKTQNYHLFKKNPLKLWIFFENISYKKSNQKDIYILDTNYTLVYNRIFRIFNFGPQIRKLAFFS